MTTPKTLFDKLWDAHVVADLGDDMALLHVDRHLIHDLSGVRGLNDLAGRGIEVMSPGLCFATPDHTVSTAPDRMTATGHPGAKLAQDLREHAAARGIRLFDIGELGHGIVHVIGPELGLTLPGVLLACGDSHTCTHGGLGALAFGIGSSEVTHVLATQTIAQKRPQRMRVRFDGALGAGATAKDLVLYLIGQIGAAGGSGYAVEYAGPAIRALSAEGRMTICNLSIELGAKFGMVAPDDVTFDFVAGRPFAPTGALWDRAVAHWSTLQSDDGADFDREVAIDTSEVTPQVTWGTSPEQVLGIDGRVPDPAAAPDAERRQAWAAALDYMGLEPGQAIAGQTIDRVFIGSCTNSRIGDLRQAAAVVQGRKVAGHVTAWVVPGSEGVKREAEREGLDRVFRDAGFDWREPGCSMCAASNGDAVPPGERSVSTTNRNFVGRQGPGARTHLASPAMAAAAAVEGAIVDIRKLGRKLGA